MDKLQGRVLKAVAGKFIVKSDNIIYDCLARGILKRYGAILVGDIVEFRLDYNQNVIEKIFPRKNALIRPPVSNIDNALIVIAPIPKPDLMLVDKLIVNCNKQDIKPILCYNKTDIEDIRLTKLISKVYSDVIDAVFVSATTKEGINSLVDMLKGKFTCFAGQSAVGKSSLINSILGKDLLEIGELSRIERGRNTTRHIEIIDIGKDILVADTCGFSSLESIEMPPEELSLYYDEYMKYADKCKYKGCIHINEPNCAVKQAVEDGKLSKDRYQRYLQIYNEIKDKWSRRYE